MGVLDAKRLHTLLHLYFSAHGKEIAQSLPNPLASFAMGASQIRQESEQSRGDKAAQGGIFPTCE